VNEAPREKRNPAQVVGNSSNQLQSSEVTHFRHPVGGNFEAPKMVQFSSRGIVHPIRAFRRDRPPQSELRVFPVATSCLTREFPSIVVVVGGVILYPLSL
jgi:hypothetical protein